MIKSDVKVMDIFTETIISLDLLSRRNFSRESDNQRISRQKAITKRERRVVEDLKLHEEKGFLRRLAIPYEHGNLFANSAQPIKRPKQLLKSSSWRDTSIFCH